MGMLSHCMSCGLPNHNSFCMNPSSPHFDAASVCSESVSLPPPPSHMCIIGTGVRFRSHPSSQIPFVEVLDSSPEDFCVHQCPGFGFTIVFTVPVHNSFCAPVVPLVSPPVSSLNDFGCISIFAQPSFRIRLCISIVRQGSRCIGAQIFFVCVHKTSSNSCSPPMPSSACTTWDTVSALTQCTAPSSRLATCNKVLTLGPCPSFSHQRICPIHQSSATFSAVCACPLMITTFPE